MEESKETLQLGSGDGRQMSREALKQENEWLKMRLGEARSEPSENTQDRTIQQLLGGVIRIEIDSETFEFIVEGLSEAEKIDMLKRFHRITTKYLGIEFLTDFMQVLQSYEVQSGRRYQPEEDVYWGLKEVYDEMNPIIYGLKDDYYIAYAGAKTGKKKTKLKLEKVKGVMTTMPNDLAIVRMEPIPLRIWTLRRIIPPFQFFVLLLKMLLEVELESFNVLIRMKLMPRLLLMYSNIIGTSLHHTVFHCTYGISMNYPKSLDNVILKN